jgi:hypothetical protein
MIITTAVAAAWALKALFSVGKCAVEMGVTPNTVIKPLLRAASHHKADEHKKEHQKESKEARELRLKLDSLLKTVGTIIKTSQNPASLSLAQYLLPLLLQERAILEKQPNASIKSPFQLSTPSSIPTPRRGG